MVHTFQDFLDISDYTGIRLDIFVDLRRIHIKLQNLRIARKSFCITNDTVTETDTNGDQQIAFAYTIVGSFCTMHSEHSAVSVIGSVKCPFSHQGITYRCIHSLCKFCKFFTCSGNNCTASYKDIRFFRITDHGCCPLQISFSHFIDLACNRWNLLKFKFRCGCSNILWNIYQHRSRTPGLGNPKCTADHISKFVNIFYNKIMLCDRCRDTCDINLLKTVLSKQWHTYITGNSHHWNRIHVCGCDTGYQICCTRSGSSQTHTNFTGGTGISIRSMGSSLFMGRKHMVNFIAMFV